MRQVRIENQNTGASLNLPERSCAVGIPGQRAGNTMLQVSQEIPRQGYAGKKKHEKKEVIQGQQKTIFESQKTGQRKGSKQ